MASGSKYCKVHKNTVEEMAATFKKHADEQGAGTPAEKAKLGFIEAREKACDNPPSPFSNMVIGVEAKFPPAGRGKNTGVSECEAVVMVENHGANSQASQGLLLEMMHEEKWMHFATETNRYPRDWAVERWRQTKEAAPEKDTDKAGPPRSRLRLPMPKSDFIKAANIVEQEKGVEMTSNRRKVGDASDIAEMQNAVGQNHVSFNNNMFNSVGGGAIHAVAQQCACGIGLRGEGAFTGSSGDEHMFPNQLELAAKRKDESKDEEANTPNKVQYLELVASRMFQNLLDIFENLKNNIVVAEQENNKTDQMAEPSDGPSRLEGHNMIVGLAVAKDRMNERASLLSFLNVTRETLPGFLLLFTNFSLLFTPYS
ncbi:hypothetical protein N9L19_00880 [bacterium]|nr:hypothetical protein [bacterium]